MLLFAIHASIQMRNSQRYLPGVSQKLMPRDPTFTNPARLEKLSCY